MSSRAPPPLFMFTDGGPSTPSIDPKLIQYAKWLGVPSPKEYPQLLPLLNEGLRSELPEGWQAVVGEYGNTLFFHKPTGACRTDHPLDEEYKAKCLEVVRQVDSDKQQQQSTPASRRHIASVAAEFEVFEQPRRQPPNTTASSTTASDQLDLDDLMFDHDDRESAGVQELPPTNSTGTGVPQRSIPPISLASAPLPESAVAHQVSARIQHIVDSSSTGTSSPQSGGESSHHHQREELLELQRELETLKAANIAMKSELEKSKQEKDNGEEELPTEFYCPITGDCMRDPVVTADGFTYERGAISMWLQRHDTSPCTNQPLEHKMLVPNLALRSQIQAKVFKQKR